MQLDSSEGLNFAMDYFDVMALLMLPPAIWASRACPVRGVGRFVSPDFICVWLLFVVFAIRPLFRDRYFESTNPLGYFYGYVPSMDGQRTASAVGLVGLSAVAAGAALASLRKRRRAAHPVRDGDSEGAVRGTGIPQAERGTLTQVFIVTIGASLSYVGLMAALLGSSGFSSLSNGRSADATLAGVPEVVMILPLAAPIAGAAYVLGRPTRSLRPSELLTLTTTVAVSVSLVSQLGNRRFIIPALLIPIVALLIRRPSRLRVPHVLTGVVAITWLAIIPFVRSAGSRRPGEGLLGASWRFFAENGIGGVLRPLLTGYDTEMYDYIALVAGRSDSPIPGLGKGTIVEFFTHPLPGTLIDSAPFSDAILTKYWGGGCGDPVCPVASTFGVLYFDGLWIAVLIGGLALGYGLRWLAYGWLAYGSSPVRHSLMVATVSAFAPIFVRTNTIYGLWWCIYSLIFAWFVARYLKLDRPVVRRARRHGLTSAANHAAG